MAGDLTLKRRIDRASQRLAELLSAGRPLCVAWSAGKDSSVLLNLALSSAADLAATGQPVPTIVVTHGDTLIENPEVAAHAQAEMLKVEAFAQAAGIDVRIAVAEPSLNDHWSVRVIGGRGLPTFANSASRDCTVDFKIRPMKRLRKRLLGALNEDSPGAPVTLVGTRFDESSGRARRMEGRGEDDLVIREQDGELFLSPICHWSTDEVWEYLGLCRSGAVPAYSDFDDTFRLYADAGGTSCAVVADMAHPGQKKSGGCGARFGCGLCTAVGRDRSLETMIDTDDRYAYLRDLNRLQRFLVDTQYDLGRRNWVGRSINKQGYIAIAPDTYHPTMLEELLRYALTIDVREAERADRAGTRPAFELVPPDVLITIDAMWSLQGFHKPFHALSIYRDIVLEGQRYDVPQIAEPPKKSPIPAPRYLYVGRHWDQGTAWYGAGLDDLRTAMASIDNEGCRGMRQLRDGKWVMDVDTGPYFSVNIESACLVLDLELGELLRRYHDAPKVDVTEGYRYYTRMGVVGLASGQVPVADEILRRTAFKQRQGLTGGYDIDELLRRTVSKREMESSLKLPRPAVAERPAGSWRGTGFEL